MPSPLPDAAPHRRRPALDRCLSVLTAALAAGALIGTTAAAAPAPTAAPVVNPTLGVTTDERPDSEQPVPGPGGITRYVSPDGTGRGGLESNPAGYVSTLSSAKPNDVVVFLPGTYGALILDRSGEPDRPITYYGRAGAVIETTPTDLNGVLVLGDHLVVQGFTVVGHRTASDQAYATSQEKNRSNPRTTANGIYIAGKETPDPGPHHIVVKENVVRDFPGGGIAAVEADFLTFEDNAVFRNSYWSPNATSGISVLEPVNTNTGSYTEPSIVIRGNYSHDNCQKVNYIESGTITDGNGIIIDRSNITKYKGSILITANLVRDNCGRGINSYLSDRTRIVGNVVEFNLTDPELAADESEVAITRSLDSEVRGNRITASPGATAFRASPDAEDSLVLEGNQIG